MIIRFYMDQHVPIAISKGLRDKGVNVLTAFEDGSSDWSDERLLERATELDRVLFTQDQDFLKIAHEWAAKPKGHQGIIYAAQTSVVIGRAIRDLEHIFRNLDSQDMAGRVIYLPLR